MRCQAGSCSCFLVICNKMKVRVSLARFALVFSGRWVEISVVIHQVNPTECVVVSVCIYRTKKLGEVVNGIGSNKHRHYNANSASMVMYCQSGVKNFRKI